MSFKVLQSSVLTLILLAAAAIAPQLSYAGNVGTPVEDIPELPKADGSSDTPEIEVTLIDGKKVKLSSLRGKVCVIDMFASWCPHCQDHAPQVAKVYSQFKAQGFTMLSLATDKKEDVANVKKFIKDYGFVHPVGFISNEVMAYYADPRNHSIPQVILFGKDGKMMKRWVGWSEERTKELTSLVQNEIGNSVLSEAAAPVPAAKDASIAPKKTAVKATVRRKK